MIRKSEGEKRETAESQLSFGVSRLDAGGSVCQLVVLPSRSFAGTLSTAIIGMFPKNVGEFAYADLKSARKSAWFPQLREQLLPSRFREFEKFLSSAGVDPNTQVDELAWGGITRSKAGGEDVVGVALGTFDPSSTEARFKQQKLPTVEYHGYHLYAYGSGQRRGRHSFHVSSTRIRPRSATAPRSKS